MPVTQVTVQYVNGPKPGKKMGSIKDTTGMYYSVWPDKLNLFAPEQTYAIEYEENERGYRSFKKMANGSAQSVGSVAGRVTGGVSRPNDAKAEEMFVMGFMNRCYQSTGSVPSQTQLINEMMMLRQAWQAVWKTNIPKVENIVPDDPSDEIPF